MGTILAMTTMDNYKVIETAKNPNPKSGGLSFYH